MTRRYITAVFLIMAMWLGGARAALAKDGPGTQVVRKANDEIRALLRQKVEPGSEAEKKLAAKVTTSVRDFLDIEALGRRALRDHWDKIGEAKQREFMTLLRELIEKNYIKGLRANLEYEVVYTGETKRGNELVVTTEVKTTRRGRPYTIRIDYVLEKVGSGWRAYDVVTDGVGLVDNYRAQFNKIIEKNGIDGLLERMKKKADKM